MNTMDNERRTILNMVSQGKVTPEDGARLLTAVAKPAEEPVQPAESQSRASTPRWFRVRVSDIRTGKNKVTVNLPFGMVRWGLGIGARFSPELEDFDMQELADMLEQGYSGKLIDVLDEEDGEHVEIYVE